MNDHSWVHIQIVTNIALKLLRPEVLAHPESAERFFREASVCAGIDSEQVWKEEVQAIYEEALRDVDRFDDVIAPSA